MRLSPACTPGCVLEIDPVVVAYFSAYDDPDVLACRLVDKLILRELGERNRFSQRIAEVQQSCRCPLPRVLSSMVTPGHAAASSSLSFTTCPEGDSEAADVVDLTEPVADEADYFARGEAPSGDGTAASSSNSGGVESLTCVLPAHVQLAFPCKLKFPANGRPCAVAGCALGGGALQRSGVWAWCACCEDGN